MQVNSTSQMQQMQQMHQMRMRNGQGQGAHGKGMGQIMQSLSQDQREEVSDLLQNLPQDDKKDIVSQIKDLDTQNLSQDELYQSIMDILNPNTSESVITPTSIDTYA
jgi:hypothetical protein